LKFFIFVFIDPILLGHVQATLIGIETMREKELTATAISMPMTGTEHAAPGANGEMLYEYFIPPPGHRNNFRYDEPPVRVGRLRRPIQPNERANTLGPLNRQPRNDSGPIRAVVRDLYGRNVVVGVMSHPPGNPIGFDTAPLEPIDRTG
jgi:hypothetical protein